MPFAIGITLMASLAVYAGSLDPATEGHLDIVHRAAALFDHLIIAVSDNPQKRPVFTVKERMRFLNGNISLSNVEVDSFSGLLVDYMRKRGARVVIRGLRAVSDLDYEFQMASMNSHLYPQLETVFMMPDQKYIYLSSSMVKEIAALGGDLRGLVPPDVAQALRDKLHKH